MLILWRATCYTSKNGIQELKSKTLFFACISWYFIFAVFCIGWCFPLIRRSEILYIKRPWRGTNKHFVEKKGKHLTMFWFPTSFWEVLLYHPLCSWYGKGKSIFQIFHASKLSCQGNPNSMWQTSKDNLTLQCGGTVRAIQEHFVFQKCHLKMDSLGKWFWLTEILRFFFPDCSLCVTEFCSCRQNLFFLWLFSPLLFCNWENVCHLWKLTLVVDFHVAK